MDELERLRNDQRMTALENRELLSDNLRMISEIETLVIALARADGKDESVIRLSFGVAS